MDVSDVNTLALHGPDAMDERSLKPCIVANTLIKGVVKRGKPMDLWRIKFFRAQFELLFVPLKLPIVTRFTLVQLHNLHRQFFHPSSNNLFNLV